MDEDATEALVASLEQAVHMAYDAGLFKEFCRLYEFPLPRSGIEAMIDKATGLEERRYREFIAFVRKYVWQPWIDGQMAEAMRRLG